MIQNFADWLVYGIFGIAADTHLGAALNFFVYDTIKIMLLLFSISLVMGVVNAYFPIDRLRTFLATRKLYGFQYVLASFFGAITPFCSCSSIPLFIGFVKGGIPLGVTFSFLITSPLVNEVAVAMFLGTFGLKVTLIYALSGIILGVVGGFILGKLKLEPMLSEWVRKVQATSQQETLVWQAEHTTFAKRFPTIAKDAWGIVKGVWIYVLVGIAVGAGMHGYVPEGFFESYLSADNPFAVPVAVLVGIPLYAGATGIVPVMQVLVAKGVPIGTALAFMMATVGLSLPEATMLKKVMTLKLIALFFGLIGLFIIISGYLFNLIL